MKKTALLVLSAMIIIATTSVAHSKTTTELAEYIKMYKSQNYTECYDKLSVYTMKEQSDALAYYYLAMAATQLGKQDEAIDNYSKAISLAPANSNLAAYARKGKRCLEAPEACEEAVYDTPLEEFIKKSKNIKISDEVNSQIEKLKIEEMMRKMNRFEDIDRETFKQYHDFSTMDTKTPSNDEIVAALRTLQKAGLSNFANSNYSDLSFLSDGNGKQDSILDMMGSSKLSPQIIQTMLTNNMSLGF